MEEWKEYKISDIIDDISMGPFGSNIKRENYVDFGVPYLNGSNLSSYKLNEDSFYYVTEDKAKSLGRCVAKRGDIIVTHRGTIGQISYIPYDSMYDTYLTGNSQFRVSFNNSLIRPDFLVYYFHTRIGQHKLLSNASQVGVPALARPTSTFKELTISIPPLNVQNHIMDIILSIDNKIECNNRINENLEQQAQALFKSWFVDFDPFKDQPFVESELGMIPQGCDVKSLSEIADYVNGLAMQKFRPEEGEVGLPVLKIKELGQGRLDEKSELCSPSLIGGKYIINDGDIIFSWSGTLMVKVWCGGKCGLNQHLFVVLPKELPKWFVFQWTKYHLDNFIHIAQDKAVTMGHIKRGELDKAKVIIPNMDALSKIDAIIAPIFDNIVSNEIESRRLAELRDALLPKLMSGEIMLMM